ncbi:hypothetical protein BGX34_004552 [Mortierella sp. NVP85]|nr:hypothetical protein BGX34_004552 [Mortierella sp. NVP85]
MLDIPELDELICQQLSRHDLTQCTRVCKKWRRIVTPYIWRDLSSGDFSEPQQAAFVQLVAGDYLQEQQHQETHHERRSMGQQLLSPPYRPLAKYGHLVQRLPCPKTLERYFEGHSIRLQLKELVPDGHDIPSKLVLMEHLYKQCPNFQTELVTIDTLDNQMDLAELIREHVLPRTRCLQFPSGNDFITSFRLKWMLNRSSTLEQLILCANIYSRIDEKEKAYDQEEPETWQLKRLTMRNCRDVTNNNTFWPWLWKRCGQVEHLEVDNIHNDIWKQLIESGITYMPNLDKVTITSFTLDKKHIEALLSSSRRGWKEVRLHYYCESLPPTPTAYLMKHRLTLQRLVLDGYCGVTESEKAQLLACCPHLCDFTDVHTMDHENGVPFGFNAHSFIDLDPDTGSLRRWECEASLKVLKVIIKDIPRPDLYTKTIDESYSGQGRDIQNQVYDRLALFTNLEILSLRVNFGNPAASSCLEMSLESGLDKLSGLKRLKVLDVSGMETEIGEPEAQWMIKQWPKLRTIQGLPLWGGYNEAWDWLQKHHPEIDLKKPSIDYEI